MLHLDILHIIATFPYFAIIRHMHRINENLYKIISDKDCSQLNH